MTAIARHAIYSRSGKLEMGMPVAIVSIAAASSLLLASSLMLHYSMDSFFYEGGAAEGGSGLDVCPYASLFLINRTTLADIYSTKYPIKDN
jgi:hypothetical protein